MTYSSPLNSPQSVRDKARFNAVGCILWVLLVSCTTEKSPSSEPVDSTNPWEDTDESAWFLDLCPSFSGFPTTGEIYEKTSRYEYSDPLHLGPPSSLTISYLFPDRDGSVFSVAALASTDPSLDYSQSAGAEAEGSCTDAGFKLKAISTIWRLTDPWGTFDVETTTTATYTPPLLLIPADLDVGSAWTIYSVRKLSTDHGHSVESEIYADFTATAQETLKTVPLGEIQALRIDSSSGSSFWVTEGAGLIAGPGLRWTEWTEENAYVGD